MSEQVSFFAADRWHEKRSDEWYTPPTIFKALGMRFGLDPCSPLDGPLPWIPADRFLTRRENGLRQVWRRDETVWLNPPYGSDTGKWMARLSGHGKGVALVFARTETVWFQRHGATADAACFLRNRIRFVDKGGKYAQYTAPAPSVLLAWGSDCAEAVRRCGLGLIATWEH